MVPSTRVEYPGLQVEAGDRGNLHTSYLSFEIHIYRAVERKRASTVNLRDWSNFRTTVLLSGARNRDPVTAKELPPDDGGAKFGIITP